MKINELNLDGYKHIKNNIWGLPSNLEQYLLDNNFDLIGEGDLSKVFQSPTENFVVKINKGQVEKDYEKFVNFCRKNPNDPHLPKFGQIKMIKKDGINFYYIVFIEKLKIAPSNNDINFKVSDFVDHTWRELINDDQLSVNELYETVKDWDLNYNNGNVFKSEYVDQFLGLTKTLKNMRRYIKAPILDIWAGNLGIRDDNTLVLLDPVREV